MITRIRKAKARSTVNTVVYHTRETKKSVLAVDRRKTRRSCGKKNHYPKVCTSRGNKNRRQAHSLETGDLYIGTIAKEAKVDTVESSEKEWYVTLEIEQHNVKLVEIEARYRC